MTSGALGEPTERRASQQVPPLEIEIALHQPLADPVIFALDDVDAEMLEPGDDHRRSLSKAAAVTARVTSSASCGSAAAIASSSSSRKHDDEQQVRLDEPRGRRGA